VADLAAAMSAIPQGWRVTLDWHNDDWPCVEMTRSRNFGRDKRVGHGNAADLTTAILAAVQEATAQIVR
jgi:hypothetical protein